MQRLSGGVREASLQSIPGACCPIRAVYLHSGGVVFRCIASQPDSLALFCEVTFAVEKAN